MWVGTPVLLCFAFFLSGTALKSCHYALVTRHIRFHLLRTLLKCVDGFCIEYHKNKRLRSQGLMLVWKASERRPVEKEREGEVLS